MTTMFLNPATWDLCLDTSGNIALATPPYELMQSVANAARLFLGELWFNTTAGVPYFQDVLSQQPNLTFVAAKLQAAALTVPGVVTAQVFLTGIVARKLSGQIQFTDTAGQTQTVGL